jgi:hypothetical protein
VRRAGFPWDVYEALVKSYPHPHHDRGAGPRHRAGSPDDGLGYVREHKQFGQPIAEFQDLQFMIADMTMKLATWLCRSPPTPTSSSAATAI